MNRRDRSRLLAGLFVALAAVLWALPALAVPPYKYYVLAPEHLASDLTVTSLEPGNTITAGVVQRSLGAYESATIPASELVPGAVISGTARFTVGSNANAADLLAADSLEGTEFVIPHVAGNHKYYVQATTVTANLTIRLGAATDTLQINPGTAYEIDAGSDNGIAGRINSDQPIVVAHVAYSSGTPRDAYPVPPTSTEVVGVRSQQAIIGAGTDGTSITVYTSDGTSASYSLDAGQKVAVAVGASTGQGAGAALRVVANHPVAAIQQGDGDGDDASAFWSPSAFSQRHAVPVNAQYVAVACLQTSVSVTLFKGSTTPETQTCSASSTNPGKVYFGFGTSGNNVSAGWVLHASAPVYVMYEAATPEDEHNLSGIQSSVGPAAPTLDAVSSPTTSNPLSITGTASASATVRLYVNGRLQQTATASGGGTFSFNAELFDGNNVVHAVTVASGLESDRSNVVEAVYNNTVPRSQSGTISGNVVWTPGSPASPYLITANATIASGAKLVLQPGTTVQFANGTSLTVNGALKISGTGQSPVTLTSSAGSPTRGIWAGITLNATASGSEISNALIDWASVGVMVNGASVTMRNSTIRNFPANAGTGVYVKGAGASATQVLSNTIQGVADEGRCIVVEDSSPLISGNSLTDCDRGVYVYHSGAPNVIANTITSNDNGFYMDGVGLGDQPIVTGNRIHANDEWNYFVTGFAAGAQNIRLNATGNWWGSADIRTIANGISDWSDTSFSTTVPNVDFGSFLNGVGGTPVAGNYLMGPFAAASTTLTAGATYHAIGALWVTAGKSLIIPAGTRVNFHTANQGLTVDGTLTLQGVDGNPAVLSSGRTAPARGDWAGVLTRTGSTVLVEYALIDWAMNGVYANTVVTIRYSVIRNFPGSLGTGVYVKSSAASATQITSNTIQGVADEGRCIVTDVSSPTITGNTLIDCDRGIYIFGANMSSITGNNITSNDNGVYVEGNGVSPQPVVTGNQIANNDEWNYLAGAFASGAQNLKLNATGNWWGTTDLRAISGLISDWSDSNFSTTVPNVDFTGFLGAPGGAPVAGNYLFGPLIPASTTLTVGTTYEAVGNLHIPAGKSLTVPAGARINFHTAAHGITVDGTLTIQGASGNLAVVTSGRAAPVRGDWAGITLRAGSSALIEYAELNWAAVAVFANGAPVIVRNSVIRNFPSTSGTGIHVKGAAATSSQITSNLVQGVADEGRCIVTEDASPPITGNTLTDCDRGIYVFRANTSSITGNIIFSNDNGIYVDGNGLSPQPVATGNQIHSNDEWNYFAAGYAAGAQIIRLNASNNWWGTSNPDTISGLISDFNDSYTSTTVPVVNFIGFLDAVGGSPVPGNFLFGPLAPASTTLTAGATYEVLGVLMVPTGKTLVIPAGTLLKFHGTASRLVVDGTLTVQGVSGNLARLTSSNPIPARGDWAGVLIRAGTGTLIEYAEIDWAFVGIELNGVAAIVRNNVIRNFPSTSGTGVIIRGAGASATQLTSNLVQGVNDEGRCVIVEDSSPTITGNTLIDSDQGVFVYRASSPTITNNIIVSNDNGILVDGNGLTPNPVATGNEIHTNDVWNYLAGGFAAGAQNLKLNATGNWWGTTTPTSIAATISDLNDDTAATTVPTVDYSGFLNGAGGTPIVLNSLIGPFTATSTTLTAGTPYEVLGSIFVPSGKTLVIPAGATLNFHAKASLVVSGTLQIQGTTANRVRLTSPNFDRANGDWQGIVVRSTATGVVIDNAIIEWMVRGVEVTTATVTIQNSLIRNFSIAGIAMTSSGAASQIVNNYIDNYSKIGDGIVLAASSPAITGNRIYRTNRAIYMSGASSPTLTGNVLTGNNWGIYLLGNSSNSATAVPRPTINGNDIFGNTNAQLELNAYGATNPAVINATNNWWGTATPAAGTQIKFSGGSPGTTANFTSPATGPLNGATAGNIVLSEVYFSPNGDASKDSTTVQGTLSQASSWSVLVKTEGGALVRTLTGSGTNVAAVWDGANGSGVVQPDGRYDFEVTVPGPSGDLVVGLRIGVLDNTAPTLIVSTPTASSTLSSVTSVPVNGTAADLRFISYTLDYGAGTSPASWTLIQSQTTQVTNGPLGTWVVGNVSGTAGLPNGPYTLRVRASDLAGNNGVLLVPLTLDNIEVTGVTQNFELIRPLLGEQLQVGFTLSAPGTATLRIYPEQGGALVKEVSQVFATGGAKVLAWDGRNTGGAHVPDEAYSYTLTIDDGGRMALYDPPDYTDTGFGSGTVDSAFNANRNDFWKMNYTLNTPKSRVRMQVNGCGVTGTHYPYNWVPYLPGTFLTTWDGRDQNGNLVLGACDIYFDAPDKLKPASVIVKGMTPSITGGGASPNIEVRSNPYLVTHSYEHVARITYRVDHDSYVTVKLLPPGVGDPASPEAIVLVNGVLQSALSGGSPLDHVVEWKGYDELDTNNLLVTNEGTYTFAIQATSAASGVSTLYRGSLQLFR